jgi:hypothetical protein
VGRGKVSLFIHEAIMESYDDPEVASAADAPEVGDSAAAEAASAVGSDVGVIEDYECLE